MCKLYGKCTVFGATKQKQMVWGTQEYNRIKAVKTDCPRGIFISALPLYSFLALFLLLFFSLFFSLSFFFDFLGVSSTTTASSSFLPFFFFFLGVSASTSTSAATSFFLFFLLLAALSHLCLCLLLLHLLLLPLLRALRVLLLCRNRR